MYYLKNTNTDIVRLFQNEESPIDPQNWISSTEEEYLAQAPSDEMRQSKINQLNKNREEYCLILIEYNSNTYATTLEAKVAISDYANGLPTLSSTAEYPNYPQGQNILLSKADFKAIATLIRTREMASRDLRRTRKEEIENASTIKALNNININFN